MFNWTYELFKFTENGSTINKDLRDHKLSTADNCMVMFIRGLSKMIVIFLFTINGHDAAAALFPRGGSAAVNFLLHYHIICNLKDLQNVAKIGKLLATYISAYMYYYFSNDVVVFKFRYKLYLRIKTRINIPWFQFISLSEIYFFHNNYL